MTRLLLLIFITVGVGYLYLAETPGAEVVDDAFRMAAHEGPARAGFLDEKERPDLYVPVGGAAEYSVPTAIAEVAQTHETDGRRWYSYASENGLGRYRVVILFHGAGRSGLSMIDMWKDVADRERLFLIALDGVGQNWPADRVAPSILHAILAEVEGQARIDPAKIFLFGHSNGAKYAQLMINLADGPWRAAALHAGFSDPALAITPADAKPIRYYIGSREHIFLPDQAALVARAMTEKGHDVDLHIIPNHTHWFYEAGPVIAADAWAWFRTQ